MRRRALSGIESLERRLLRAADPIIQEILANNVSGILDEDGAHSDWIEIANAGDEPINLEGWHLTDDVGLLNKWTFPSTQLPPDDTVLVFASDKDRREADGELHANFKLSANGEVLALVQPDATTIASQWQIPAQRKDVSYGIQQPLSVTELIGSDLHGTLLIPSASDHERIGTAWTGASDFDESPDAGWLPFQGGVGFAAEPRVPTVEGELLQRTVTGAGGTQAFGGSLGMDFTVNEPILVSALGAFDDESDGFHSTITVQLWLRDDSGTAQDSTDDLGVLILAQDTFTTIDPGILVGGTRFHPLAERIELAPGNYTIVARGYSLNERNANSGGDGPYGELTESSAISFQGSARFGANDGGFPENVDSGPAFRYAAGTLAFVSSQNDVDEHTSAEATAGTIAYQTRTGSGNESFEGNLGMDFEVVRPVRITELGVFDHLQDGIQGTVAVSLWSLRGSQGSRLAWRTFAGDSGELADGTGSRFLELDEPLFLQPGLYSVVASGFLGDDLYSRSDLPDPVNGTVHSGNGTLNFIGTSRASFFSGTDRFIERPHHRLPERLDNGPVNKFAAGTFRFEDVLDGMIQTDVESEMYRVNTSAYLRIPFDVPTDIAAIDGMQLLMNFDDGFVAHLNGVKIAERNVPDSVTWNSVARGRRPDVGFVEALVVDVSEFMNLLRLGQTNVLAIQALNSAFDDPDFFISSRLQLYQTNQPSFVFFDEPSPDDENGKGFIGLTQPVQFSVAPGIVAPSMRDAQGNFLVRLTSATSGAIIRYTTDGSVPSLTNGKTYEGPINVMTTLTLRAAAMGPEMLPSEVTTGNLSRCQRCSRTS